MNTFKQFLAESEEKDDVKKLISKLPKGHQKLLNGFKFKFTNGHTLPKDSEHVGVIYQDKITVASPFNYSRSFVVLHEIAHLIFSYKMTKELKKEWSELVKKYKKELPKNDALNQNDEEIFAMSYGTCYAKHPVETFNHPEWIKFIKNKVPQ